MNIVMIGAGNVAVHMAQAFESAAHRVTAVYSRNIDNATALASRLEGKPAVIDDLSAIVRDADIYIFSVKDSALPSVFASMPATQGLWAHTAGSVALDAICRHHSESGVFYPLQTFSKDRTLDFSSVPLYIEAATPAVRDVLERLARTVSTNVLFCTGDQRLQLHLAAVFACNFTNHLYAIAQQLLSDHHLPADSLVPLIRETAAKVEYVPALMAQTGPAVREDFATMTKHLDLLKSNPEYQNIYKTLSKSIIELKKQRLNLL